MFVLSFLSPCVCVFSRVYTCLVRLLSILVDHICYLFTLRREQVMSNSSFPCLICKLRMCIILSQITSYYFTGINSLSRLGLRFSLTFLSLFCVSSQVMSKLETLLEDGLRSELMLQQQLKALREALRQQLQETERRQREELDRRIHQNALLSTDHYSFDENKIINQAKYVSSNVLYVLS